MTREEKIAILKDIIDGEIVHPQVRKDVGAWAINELKQEPCEDCISRQATVGRLCRVADFMNEKREGLGSPYVMAALLIQDNKEEFPPVTPQPKMGKWLIVDDCEHFIAKCSECGRVEDSRLINNYPYCHCGVKMETEDV